MEVSIVFKNARKRGWLEWCGSFTLRSYCSLQLWKQTSQLLSPTTTQVQTAITIVFCSFMLHTDTSAFKHLSHFGLIYSKWLHVYVKICWKCARNYQAGLWDLVTCTSLWTSKWGVTKLTFRGICGCWFWCWWCNITGCPIYTCRTNSELSKMPIFDSITKTCNNICLGCGGVELQC